MTWYVYKTIIVCAVLYKIKSGLLLRKIFGSVKDEIECAWRKSDKEQKHITFEVLVLCMKCTVS
jgi:hypothetical protein